MLRKMSLRLPIDIYEELFEEALRLRVSVSDVVREKILSVKHSNLNSSFQPPSSSQNEIFKQDIHVKEKIYPSEENDFVNLEILFLFREFLFERNAQILKKVDEKLDRRFGKDRKRPG